MWRAQFLHSQMALSMDLRCSGLSVESYRGPPVAAAVMCAASPMDEARSGCSFGPVVGHLQAGFEQWSLTRRRKVVTVVLENSCRPCWFMSTYSVKTLPHDASAPRTLTEQLHAFLSLLQANWQLEWSSLEFSEHVQLWAMRSFHGVTSWLHISEITSSQSSSRIERLPSAKPAPRQR